MVKVGTDLWEFGKGAETRRFSWREAAAIQTFPKDLEFCGDLTSKYKQIGNAVPVGLAKAIGEAVIAAADGTAVIETKRFRGTAVHRRIKDAIELGSFSGSVVGLE